MALVVFKCDSMNAMGVHNLIKGFSGDAGYYQKRAEACTKIIAAWPEFLNPPTSQQDKDAREEIGKEEREIELTSSELMAVVDGALNYVKDPLRTDANKDRIKALSRLLKFRDHLNHFLSDAAKRVKGFTDCDQLITPDQDEPNAPAPAMTGQQENVAEGK